MEGVAAVVLPLSLPLVALLVARLLPPKQAPPTTV